MTIEKMQELNDQESSTYDSEFYKLTTDKAGNGTAIIRFLPPMEGDQPMICYYNHWFKGPGDKVYNELCLSTIGKPDPVNEANSKLWNSGFDADKKIVSVRKRKTNYVANILVIRDTAKPDNENKIFKYRFGKKIKDKIDAAWKVAKGFEDEAVQPFNLGPNGADFILDQKKKDGYPNYDDSRFRAKGAIYGGDMEKLKTVLKGQEIPSLKAMIDPSKFKPYAELKKRFLEVIDESGEPETRAGDVDDRVADQNSRIENENAAKRTQSVQEETKIQDAGDDEDLAFFRKASSKA